MPIESRDIISGAVAAAALGAVAVVHAPVAIVGLVPVVVFVGLRFFVLDAPKAPEPEPQDTTIEDGLAQARAFAELAPRIRNPRMRERVEHLSQRLTRILDKLRRDNRRDMNLSIFVRTYLPRTIEVVRDYIELSDEPELNQEVIERSEQTIDQVADALKELYVKLFDEQMLRLDVTNGTLKELLDTENPRRRFNRNRENQP